MKSEELAFVNHQLAGMLRVGIPLEGALAQLCTDMERGPLRSELSLLRDDLAQGTPLREALARRQLPRFYARMVGLGASGGDLPGVLTLLADYYQRSYLLWTRLKGLLVYPAIVLVGSLALAILTAWVFSTLSSGTASTLSDLFGGSWASGMSSLALVLGWIPAVVLTIVLVTSAVALTLPTVRARLRWTLPGFRESALAQLASTLHLLLTKGCTLDDALALAEQLEMGSPAAAELAAWRQRLAAGAGRPQDFAVAGPVFPPLFRWLVAQGGEDLAAGFKRAAEVYHARALYRTDVMLYLVLPVSVVVVGTVILAQVVPLLRLVVIQLNGLGDLGAS